MRFTKTLFVPETESLKRMILDAQNGGGAFKWSQYTFASSGIAWRHHRRPFLNVWPSVERALLRTSLDVDPALIPPSIIHELLAVEIRFAESSGRLPFMLCITEPRQWVGITGEFMGLSVSRSNIERNAQGESFVNCTAHSVVFENKNADVAQTSSMKEELKIALGVLMLASDPEFCTPLLLNRDANRKLTGGDLDKAIERAKRNGKFGFNIGKDVEISPHYRRPHFALRWTGLGGKIPRLVPVKGAFIRKGVLGEVPTGYEDDALINEESHA